MADQNILQWKLFRNLCSPYVKLKEYSAVHFFNNGESGYLIKDDQLYLISFQQPLVSSALGVSPSFPNLTRSNNIEKIDNFGYNGIKAIGTGNSHTVLLDSAGHVFCWGSNTCGELGVGHCSEVNIYWKTNLENIDQIACGQTFTIALSKCDEIWFWGKISNEFYNVIPTLIEINGDPVPKSISAGDHHFAVITEDSKVYMMGNNEDGQLALGHRNLIKQPESVSLDIKVSHVQCAHKRTIFLTETNGLYVCDRFTNNTVKCISDAHKIVSLATHWRTDFFVAVDECGFFYRPLITDDKMVLVRAAYYDISDGFIDIGTPSVYWPVNALVGSTKTSSGLTSLTCNMPTPRCANHINVSHLYNSKIHSDIEIKLSDGNIRAHKLVLTLQSPYFERMLKEAEGKAKLLDMTNMNTAVYKAYINFLYTGKVLLDSVLDLPELYSIAEKDENIRLKSECIQVWSKGLNKENIVKAYEKAFLLNSKELIEHCCSLLNVNLQYILNSDVYNCLDVSVKLALLTSAATHRAISENTFIPVKTANSNSKQLNIDNNKFWNCSGPLVQD
ncbi:hypothetical protein O3M35_011549 [Rhynocoris fuscipes]|uniref:BTB domain-containing protein n=1 Tax=Rhynocoris fuscipes TaxID=488301 RepID=A0AAW1CZ84_9HEMI